MSDARIGEDSEQTRRWASLLAAGWIVVILLASMIDPAGSAPSAGGSRPLGIGLFTWLHVGAYGILAWLVVETRRENGARAALLAVVVASAVGLGIESIQTLLAARTASAADAVANAVGALAGVTVRALGRSIGSRITDRRQG